MLADGSKRLLALEMCTSESRAAWSGSLENLVARELVVPTLCVVDGNPGLCGALGGVWPKAYTLDAIKGDYNRIVYAASLAESHKEYAAFARKWKKSCPGGGRVSRRAATSSSRSLPSPSRSGSA